MQLWLQNHFEHFKPSPDVFDPTKTFASTAAATKTFSTAAILWAFVGVRIAGAVLVVPVMEELFWRDYLWRQISSPNDFKIPPVGERDWVSYLAVSGVFAVVHGNWWLTAIVWALMVGALLIYTKSLGACVVAHATTNLLLAIYVLKYRAWDFW
jgi:CAAX prenyl protease-like protein